MSDLRVNAQTERRDLLKKNPLFERIRISTQYPHLPNDIFDKITVKTEIADSPTAPKISQQISLKSTAIEMMNFFYDLYVKKASNKSPFSGEPSKFVFQLSNTDEIIDGDIPLINFVCIREFLLNLLCVRELAKTNLFALTIVNREKVINDIREIENHLQAFPEPESSLFFDEVKIEPQNPSFTECPCLAHSQIQNNFQVRICSLNRLPTKEKFLSIKALLICGTQILSTSPIMIHSILSSDNVNINKIIEFNMKIKNLPQTSRLSLTIYGLANSNFKKGVSTREAPIGTINFALFDYQGWLNQGTFTKRLWMNHDTDLFLSSDESPLLNSSEIIFDVYDSIFPIAFSPSSQSTLLHGKGFTVSLPPDIRTKYENLLHCTNPLISLEEPEKQFIWKCHSYFPQTDATLFILLKSIDYSNPEQAQEIPKILESYQKLQPIDALQLLGASFPNILIRKFAIECLENLADHEILLYMLQLVQALKYEIYDDSELARFLIRRGMKEPKFVGHALFWQLMSESSISHIQNRFTLLLINFVFGLGKYRKEFIEGYIFTKKLIELNTQLLQMNVEDPQSFFKKSLAEIEIPNEFRLPMDPRIVVDKFIIDSCQVMKSKKKPFFLVFHNASIWTDEPVRTLFKVGDDLRQDQLTLQIMKIMEHLWLEEGLDLQMRCYGVLPTGQNQGFIEVVPNAITESKIQRKKGKIMSAWDPNIFIEFLQEDNQTPIQFKRAVEYFKLSSAGYAISTCILGVTDRHPDNIMVQKDGHYFHIDFGHFMGNFKTKLGYQRENAPFHFSPACKTVLQDCWEEFGDICVRAFNILRHNSKHLFTALTLMIGIGIPELTKPEDMEYMKNMLFLNLTDEEAGQKFLELIDTSLNSTKTLLNNIFHNLKA